MKEGNKGFTLVELIAVICLLMMLSVLAVFSYVSVTDAAKAEAVQSDAEALARAINHYNSLVRSERIEVNFQNLDHDGDYFPLVVKAEENGLVDMDLSVMVGYGHATNAMDMLVWEGLPGGSGGRWIVNP